MKPMAFIIFIVHFGFLQINPASAWALHYLITDRSLAPDQTKEIVRVEPIESFLTAERRGLERFFDDYYEWLTRTGSKRFIAQKFTTKSPDLIAFLTAARLNPSVHLYYVRRASGLGEPSNRSIDYGKINPFEKPTAGFSYRFEEVSSTTASARDVLVTYSDEPDWGMDQRLWQIQAYGYGKIPYGNENETSSAAPFHMQFAHENAMVRWFAPEILEGMTLERLELFSRLSRFAFRTGHRYWGYRFAAWAIHYIQDLTQPYHSKATPSAGLFFYLKFGFSLHKRELKNQMTQLVANRHYLFEDFIAARLEDSVLIQKRASGLDIARNLGEESGILADLDLVKGLRPLFDRVTRMAADRAAEIDRQVVRAFGPRLTEDPRYNLLADPSYRIRALASKIPPERAEMLLAETAQEFHLTGAATRRLVNDCTGGY